MPFAPLAAATSASFSMSPRDQLPAPLALMHFTTLPASTALENTPKPQPRTMSVSSTSSMPKRTSGRSQPKRSMASFHGMRCSGNSCCTPAAARTSLNTPSIKSMTSVS